MNFGLVENLFTVEDKTAIVDAVRHAEARTSGEIRVHMQRRAGDDLHEAARRAFVALHMEETERRNGVLFFLSLEDRRFAIIADDGIYHAVPSDFWDDVTRRVLGHFSEGRLAQGLVDGIEQAGEQLAALFPHQDDDVNELPDDISEGDLSNA